MIGNVVPGLPAAAAGSCSGDRLLEVGGQPIRNESDYDQAALDFRRGERSSMAVDRDGRRLELEVRPGVPPPRLNLLLNLFVALAYGAVAIIAFSQAARDVRARLLTIFALAVAFEEVLPFEPLNVLLARPPFERSPSICSPVSRWASRSTWRCSSPSARRGSSAGDGWCRSSTRSARRSRW